MEFGVAAQKLLPDLPDLGSVTRFLQLLKLCMEAS
jgi:hypothetical protein